MLEICNYFLGVSQPMASRSAATGPDETPHGRYESMPNTCACPLSCVSRTIHMMTGESGNPKKTNGAPPLKCELTTDNQLAGGRPNFQRRVAEIKHLICTEVNNHILYGTIT